MDFFPLIALLMALAALASYINHRYIRWPTTIGVMLVSLLASLGLIITGSYSGGLHDHAAALIAQIDFDHLVLHVLLAFLLFAGSIHVQLKDLAREWLPISLLAVLGILLSTVIVGGLTWFLLRCLGLQIPFVHALIFGSLISPTDPIAVMGIMKSVGAPRQLEVQVAGESLFNDGLAVVLFLVLLQVAGLGPGHNDPAAIGVPHILFLMLKEIGGALVLGLATGWVTYQLLKRVNDYHVEVLLTLALAMGVYALADSLHLSAPIAVVVAGLLTGNHGRAFAMSNKTREYVDKFWELVDEILNVLLFLLTGLQLLVLPLTSHWLLAGVLSIPVVLLARWMVVAGIMFPLGRIKPQSRGAIAVLTWGGLRGGISVAMALSLPASTSRGLTLTLTYCVVVFSVIVQGLSIGRVIRKVTSSPAALVAG